MIKKTKYIFLSSITLMSKLIFLAIPIDTNNANVPKFLISTKTCKIPSYPLISSSIQKLMIPKKTTNCTENIHLLDYNTTHIWVVEESFDFYNVLRTNDFYCCYRHFHANHNMEKIVYGKCFEFTTVIEAKHEFTRVECFYLDTKMYDDFFLFPTFTESNVTRINKSLLSFNVLLLGIESMSRINFLRTMPKTAQFLQEKGSIQLLGYNKVDDNSIPNLFPLLFGKSYEKAKKSCIKNNVINGSECVFLWTNFKEAGYHTALGSDSIAGLLDHFEYNLPEIPTDFYLQPFIFETRNIFDNKHFSFHKCLHNKYYYKLLLDWSAKLMKIPNKKLFGIFWEESISHENFNVPTSMDDDYFLFLEEIENSKYLDDSIVVLFSDHGARWGAIAQTEQGRAENRLPLFEILFPVKFQRRFPLAFNNFKLNRYTLTSPYDIHETLIDLVHGNYENSQINARSKQIAYDASKLSLFLPISNERTCKIIGINEHWCACQENESNVMREEDRIFAANYVVEHINKILRSQPKCYQLKISKIINATVVRDENNKIQMYWVVLSTSPGGGIFDSTLYRKGSELYVSGTVTRLNLYRYASKCIQDHHDIVKMYCTCK